MRKVLLTLVACSLASLAGATEGEEDAAAVSPDKKWAYRLVDGSPAIVRAESGEVALKLSEDGNSLQAETGKVLWAPDSRRVAFNYRAGGRVHDCAVYELAVDKWKPLPDLGQAKEVEKLMARAEERDRKRLGVRKNAYRRRISDEWTVRRWIDRDTFEVFAQSTGSVLVKEESDDPQYIGGAVLFTVKCDNRGGWKLGRLRELSDAELEKLGTDQ
jgi:hypothetical protein